MSFDEDVKIFNRSKPLASSDSGPMADDLKRQVVSGNMQRARDLGKDIARRRGTSCSASPRASASNRTARSRIRRSC